MEKFEIIVTSQNFKRVTKHAGKCLQFLVYKIDNNQIASRNKLILAENEVLHYVFHNGENSTNHPIFNADILLTGGIGNGAINKLAKNHVKTFVVEERTADEAVDVFLNKIKLLNP